MRAALTTALEIAGLAGIAAGTWMIWPAAGVIAAGSALVLIGWRLA